MSFLSFQGIPELQAHGLSGWRQIPHFAAVDSGLYLMWNELCGRFQPNQRWRSLLERLFVFYLRIIPITMVTLFCLLVYTVAWLFYVVYDFFMTIYLTVYLAARSIVSFVERYSPIKGRMVRRVLEGALTLIILGIAGMIFCIVMWDEANPAKIAVMLATGRGIASISDLRVQDPVSVLEIPLMILSLVGEWVMLLLKTFGQTTVFIIAVAYAVSRFMINHMFWPAPQRQQGPIRPAGASALGRYVGTQNEIGVCKIKWMDPAPPARNAVHGGEIGRPDVLTRWYEKRLLPSATKLSNDHDQSNAVMAYLLSLDDAVLNHIVLYRSSRERMIKDFLPYWKLNNQFMHSI
ncbi:hypothetical protein F5Y16DRAFT_1232 [Xylariaceae sp. FL0255]|nr:hypothetical protein F5Y16DRAFT_1232 [Xylariaceae sp. FL0255]